MTWHPSDDDLILRFYGEGAGADADRISRHLETCAVCRAAWTDLSETLKLVDASSVPEPGAAFERVMWARISQALPPATPTRWTLWRILPLAAAAAVVVALVGVGLSWRPAPSPGATPSASVEPVLDPARMRERVLLTALDDHFEQTEMLLVELLNAPEGSVDDLEFERVTADDLVAFGRLYRVTAQQNGDLRLAQMLEDLEPVLVEVARRPARVDQTEFKSLRTRIDNESLLFKVRAVSNDIRDRQRTLLTLE
jgi:hypothetical protein